MNFKSKYFTEVGWLKVDGNEQYIESISFTETEPEVSENLTEIFTTLHRQFDEFFKDKRWTFNVPMNPKGTIFPERSVV